ncbi:hypothetical protein ACFL1G_07035 [Planctomycetota bacterium]
MFEEPKNIISESLEQENAIQAATDYGIDISMLIDNLKKSPSERIRRHQIALNTAEKLSKAKHIQ